MSTHSKWFTLDPYLAIIVQRPVWALVAVGMVTCLLGWHLPQLSFKTDVYDLIIEELPEAGQYRDFEPFFTTKQTGQGKGLGLTICRQIVRDCGGTIALANRAPNGAAVSMRFPAEAKL